MTRKLALVAVLGMIAFGIPLAPAGAAREDADVDVVDSSFEPPAIEIEAGTTVTWTHRGSLPHSVTASDGSFDSHPGCQPACMQSGETYSRTFTEPGTISYYCKVHGTPSGSGMAGVIEVVPEGTVRPTSVDSLEATVEADAVRVSGSATFEGEAPTVVAEDPAGDGPIAPDQADQTGVDLLSASIRQADPDTPELTFEMRVTGLPETGSLPEVIRYGFPVKTATQDFMIQAKLSNVASTTAQDDPAGHVTHAGAAFQLRGNCGQVQEAFNSCPHLGWLTGEFDTETDAIRVFLPIGGALASSVVPGAILEPNTASLGGNPTASYQAVLSNGSTEDEASWDPSLTYRVPTRRVRLGLVPRGASAEYSADATVGEDGSSFSGSLSTAGLPPGAYDLVAEACFGTNCATAATAITLP